MYVCVYIYIYIYVYIYIYIYKRIYTYVFLAELNPFYNAFLLWQYYRTILAYSLVKVWVVKVYLHKYVYV